MRRVCLPDGWAALVCAACIALISFLTPAGAAAATPAYAPLTEPGPALSPSAAQLKASLHCEPSVADAKVEPVLLSPGTSTTPTENFGWNWEPALDRLGIPWCAYTAPNQALNRIDVSGEYLVYAIRTMYAMAGRQIAILGHSQGGMSMRWALRFWPDTRAMVSDVIGLEPSNHGTQLINDSICQSLGCVPADWQQLYESPFIKALNSSAETFAGIDYTSTYSLEDEVVLPSQPGNCSQCLSTGGGQIANVELQSVCPADIADHVTGGTTDAVAYAIAADALTHPGPAVAGRIPKSACSQLLMPGVLDPESAAALLGTLEAGGGTLGILPGPVVNPISGAPVSFSEPSLPCYVYADCPPQVPLTVSASPRTATRGKRMKLAIKVTSTVSGVTLGVPDATIVVGNGRRLQTGADGSASTTLSFGRSGTRHVVATAPEYFSGRASVTVEPPARRRASRR